MNLWVILPSEALLSLQNIPLGTIMGSLFNKFCWIIPAIFGRTSKIIRSVMVGISGDYNVPKWFH